MEVCLLVELYYKGGENDDGEISFRSSLLSIDDSIVARPHSFHFCFLHFVRFSIV